jgi:type 1 glutamine amidotransferase
MLRRIFSLTLLIVFAMSVTASAEPTLKALIVDGQNNHSWQATTPVLKKALESSGLFAVDVATTPPKGQDISGWSPEFSKYNVLVLNYNGEMWSEKTQKDFESYVEGGGGVVVVHAANNAFTGWKEYNDMIGLGWRGSSFGDRVTFNDEGKSVRTPKGEGPGAGHGPQHEFQVVVRDTEHPITRGLPSAWMHAKDELYQGQRGPAEHMQILATAYAAPDQRGTGQHEPMLWVIPYGKGRVVTNVMGHADYSMKCVGFITTLQRGTEWAATGKVTLPVPEDFPSADKGSTRE